MSEFMKGSPEIDKIVTDATSGPNGGFENMREQLKAALARENRIVREDLGYGVRFIPSSEPEPAPVATAPPVNHDKVFRVVYPSGNNRFEIYGADEKELNEKERQILAMFGR